MATAAAAANPQPPPAPPPQQLLNLESLACIDTTTLSQSELHALSLCSFSAFDLRSAAHLALPQIDPATFNESTGSRRQTYSRPRPPQSSPTGRRRRVAGLISTPKLPSLPADDPENAENRVIIDYLKQFIREDHRFDQVEFAPPHIPAEIAPHVSEHRSGAELALVKFGVGKRKRGRKPKLKAHLEDHYGGMGMEVVNKNGVAIDLPALAKAEDPFAEELRRRTEGLQGEEELLGFLRDLEGQWGSRRKKRRIVDAADFGDVLPLGWKLLLGLKRKDGRAWVYCRRYVSPSGQQFVSCGEVSLYLQSLFGYGDTPLQISHGSENVMQEHRATGENSAGVTHENQEERKIFAINSEVPISSVSNERLKEVALLGMENLADVQIHDLFECHKCNMTFDDKDSYLQHLLSFHQKITRRYRLGSTVGDGVIIKEGKFECQFCHKVFTERRRYNGHVGIHVRDYVRRAEDSPGQQNVQGIDMSPIREDMPSRLSKMDALIEIAQSSIMEDSVMEPASEIALDQDISFESSISQQKMDDCLTGKNVVQDDSADLFGDEEAEETDDDSQVIDAKMVTCLDSMGFLPVKEQNVNPSETCKGKGDVGLSVEGSDQPVIHSGGASVGPLAPFSDNKKIPESGKNENCDCTNTKGQFNLNGDNSNKNEMKIGLDSCKDMPVRTNVQEMLMTASEGNLINSTVSNPSTPHRQSLDCIPAFSSDKGGKQISSVDHEHDNVKDFQELGLDEIVMEVTNASAVQIESQEVVMLNMDSRNQLTTVCVWCGMEFSHDAVNSEIQPDSVGFMCPACKAKISGQTNV